MPIEVPTIPKLDERLTAVEARLQALENKPSGLTTLRRQVRTTAAAWWPAVKELLFWILLLTVLAQTFSGCKIPNPDPAPTPTPAPLPAEGLHVMFVHEKDKLSTYPDGQREAIQSQMVRQYLDAKAAKGSDGKTPEVRTFEPTTDVSSQSKLWQDAFARPRKSLPWVWVVKGNRGYEGPLPTSPEALLDLLRKYGE